MVLVLLLLLLVTLLLTPNEAQPALKVHHIRQIMDTFCNSPCMLHYDGEDAEPPLHLLSLLQEHAAAAAAFKFEQLCWPRSS
jgi:hypothetical protein